MTKYVYPAVFVREKGGFYVNFPDIKNCFTDGSSLIEALEMAKDVLAMRMCIAEKEGEPIPKASSIKEIKVDSDSFATLILADTTDYPLVECEANAE